MHAVVFFEQVVGPVFVEVAAGDEGAQAQGGFGSLQSPAGAGDVHAVLDQVAAGSLDHAGGDRPACLEGLVVGQVGLLAGEVLGRFVGSLAFGAGVAEADGAAADSGRDLARLPLEDLGELAGDPGFGIAVALVEERPGGISDVLGDVDEVDHDGDGDAPAGGFGLDRLDLGPVAVHQADPGPLAARVTPYRLVERLADDDGDVASHAGGQPLVLGLGPGDMLTVTGAGQDLRRRAGAASAS